MGIRRVPSFLAAVVVVTATFVAIAPRAGAQESVDYRPPVDAPVVDPFRPPATTYGPGNRGLTYDLAPATRVRASAPGEVVFAGPVAGTLHVTVLHADGLRTSYSFLESISVVRGQRVDAGDIVGAGGLGFHFGVRDGSAYLDPAGLFGGLEIRVHLVPAEEPLPPTDAGLLRERIALAEVVHERNAVQRFLGRAAQITGGAIDVFRAGVSTYQQLSGFGLVRDVAFAVTEHWSDECTAGDVTVTPGGAGRVALLVGGYGSDSTRAGIDGLHTDDLGYRPGDVLRYSYAGGRIPDPDGRLDPALVGIPAHPYDHTDTYGDLEEQGVGLADLVEEVARTRPGVPIDLYAHSQGGIVARLALLDLANRPGGLDALGTVVTIGTPNDGTDLATIAVQLDASERQSVDFLNRVTGSAVDPAAVSVAQMAETSDLIRRLQREGVPPGVDFRTIGARGDLVVAGDHTTVAGHPSAILDLFGPAAHNDLPASSGTTREIGLALAGLAPACRGGLDRVLDATVPKAISFAENATGAAFVMG